MSVLLSRQRELEAFGIKILTGEACPFGQRLLCDMTEQGRRIFLDMLGLDATMSRAWNFGDGWEFSAMIPRSLLEFDLPLWCLISKGYDEFIVSDDGVCAREASDNDEEWKEYYEHLIHFNRHPQKVYPTGGPRRGTRMVHAMSDRAV